jgi:TfoX/Sxy family transcriptional regulator of competence genes
MTYDQRLAERVRAELPSGAAVAEREMFGGLAFMVGGKMACGVLKNELLVKVGKAAHDEAIARPHARPMDFTGRPMRGFVFVAPAGLRTATQLRRWLALALAHNRTERASPGPATGKPRRRESS